MARFGSDSSASTRRATIDLVTEVDLEVERMFRALIAERFPDHDVLAEEMGETGAASRHRWVFDPLDGTTNYAHGIPIFCATLALEIDGVPTVGAVFDPNRHELFTAERGVGAWLNGERAAGVGDGDADRRGARHRISLRHPRAARRTPRAVRRRSSAGARGAPARLGGDRPVLGGGRPDGRVLGAGAQAVGHDGRRADRRRKPAAA